MASRKSAGAECVLWIGEYLVDDICDYIRIGAANSIVNLIAHDSHLRF